MSNDLLKSNAKSFYWASFFLSKKTYSKCSALYNFCRTLDDIADSSDKMKTKKQNFNDTKIKYINFLKKNNIYQVKKIFFYENIFYFSHYLNFNVAKPIIAKIIEIIQNLITTVDSAHPFFSK